MSLKKAVNIIHAGGVIAYPTEAVYGLGCNPWDEQAVHKILAIKHRPVSKGLILISDCWEKFQNWVQKIDPAVLERAKITWPGPFTWIFPASESVPFWIRGNHHSVALRITAHPLARALCAELDYPLVSTSANIMGQLPLRDTESVQQLFSSQVDYILSGKVGNLTQPTEIRDLITGKKIRGAS